MSADWIGLDLSQNITPPRAPCGANNGYDWIADNSDEILVLKMEY